LETKSNRTTKIENESLSGTESAMRHLDPKISSIRNSRFIHSHQDCDITLVEVDHVVAFVTISTAEVGVIEALSVNSLTVRIH
jgi:hypothetical protein